MGRPRTEFPPAAAILALADAEGRLALRVTPGARTEAISIDQGRLLVRVHARAVDGEATQAALRLVASALGMAPSSVTLLRGATSREKLVRISGQAASAPPLLG